MIGVGSDVGAGRSGDSSGIYSGSMSRAFHAQAGTRIIARSIRIL
jgi:hypothetical protein